MNLLEKYLSSPDNYQLVGAGGSGKTTSLQYMNQKMLKDRIQLTETGEVLIPVYIRMAIFNFRKVEQEVLYDYIGSYFSLENRRAQPLIREMFRETVGKYRFLILLDGVNEVIDQKGSQGKQSIYTNFENDLGSLLEHSNVNIICTTRKEEIIFNGNYEKDFRLLKMQPLMQKQILQYIGSSVEKFDNKFLEEILAIPMLLKMFTVVYWYDQELAHNISTKYQLIENYMIAEKSLRKVEGYRDDNQEIRDCILHDILPYMAYHMEKNILSDLTFTDLTFDKLLQSAYDQEELKKKGYEKNSIKIILKGMHLISEGMIFSHDLIREFFSFKYWQKLLERKESEEVKDFLNSLISKIMFDGNSEISNRVQNFDLVELMLGYYEGELLVQKLQDAGLSKEDSLLLVQNFYQETAGVYDDLGRTYASEAVKYGWITYEYLLKIKALYDEFELAKKINFIVYCTLKGKNPERSWELLDHAEQLLIVLQEQKCSDKDERINKEIRNLLGKIYSNKGAFYYSSDLGNNYETAIQYYQKALEIRCNEKYASYKNIMSAYFQLHDFEKAYENYQLALKELGIRDSVANWYRTQYVHNPDQLKSKVLADIIERGIGAEIHVWENDRLREKIEKELCDEIRYVFEYFASGSRRSDAASLLSLKKKLADLEKKQLCARTKRVVREYLGKCKEKWGEV